MNKEKKLKIIRQYLFIGILSVVLVLFGVNYFIRPFNKYFDVEEGVENQVGVQVESVLLTRQNIFEKLSTREKITQMIAYPLVVDEKKEDELDEDSIGNIDKLSPGFIIIFGNQISLDSAKKKINEVEHLYKNSLLTPRFAVDHEGGSVQRLSGEGFTSLPSWKEMCKLENDEMESILKASASELASVGIDIVLSPVLDVGKNNILKDRICSDSYAVVARKSVKYTSVFNSFGILPVLKHFPGIGNSSKDLHNSFDSIEVLVNDIKLYEYVIDESPGVAIMISHAGIVNQEPQVPCSLSKSCINELKEAYPLILIFSDALEMRSAGFNKDNLDEPKDLSRISKEAILAGNEILIYGESSLLLDIENVVSDLSLEYENNIEFKGLVDKAVIKIVDYKYTQGHK